LTEAETRELIALRLNCRPDELAADLVARVHELCGGNPFFVSETVREWFEKAAITRSESGWVLVTMDADASDLPQTVRDAMRIRIEGLPAKTQQVLGAAAVIGAVVDIDLLRDALPDLTETEVLDAVDALLPRRVFRETGNADRVEFVHDLLRELPYGDLSASRRRVLHRRIGELLERRRGQGKQVAAAVLADHFRNAEDAPKAFAYSLEAAQAALDAYAFNNAITHLKNAQVLAPGDADNATLYDLWEKFGVAYGASGQLDDAVIAHQKAAEYAVNKLRRASANYGVGEAYHRKGEFERAKQHLDLALRDVGYPRPQSRPGRIFDMWRTSVTFHAVPTGILNLGRGPQSEERMALAADTYRRICQITGQQNVVDYTHSSYRLALFSKRSSDPEIVAAGYSKIGLNCGMFGLTWLGKTFINRAEKAAHSCKRAGVLATVQAHLGASLYFEGKLLEAETSLREAAQTLDKVGDWFGMFSHHVLRHIYSIRGDIPRTLAEAETEIAIAQLRGDADTLSWGQYGKADALARAGRVQEALEFAKIAVDSAIARNSMTVAVAQSVLGYARLQASDYSGARQVLEQSRSRGFRTMFLCEFMAPTFPMLVESLLGPHWYDPANAPSRAIVRKAWRESRVARFACTGYVNYYPHALRVSARAACALGKKSTAVRSFERSIAAAEKLGARYDVARGYLDIARVVPERREEYRKRGQSLLDELGAVVPEAERFTPESR
jgi:tetratricopeptide (TPR) repeat protein